MLEIQSLEYTKLHQEPQVHLYGNDNLPKAQHVFSFAKHVIGMSAQRRISVYDFITNTSKKVRTNHDTM
jgi:hypothetical protein